MEPKKEFRKKAILNLKKISKKKYLDVKINIEIKKYILDSNAKHVLVYLPMEIEVNIFKLIFFLKKRRNIKIYSPFIIGNEFKITPFRLPLKKNKFGIYECGDSNFNNYNRLDLAIVPIIGIDCTMRRIGFGAGMYDRYYAKLKKHPFSIFVSRTLNYSKKIITSDYDIRGNVVITRNKILKARDAI